MKEQGRLLALDVGDRRIGVAVSDPLRIIASPVVTLERRRASEDVDAVRQLVVDWQARLVVVGHPLLPSGDRGEQAKRVESFVQRLKPALNVPIVLWDESYTTVEAASRMESRGKSPRDLKDRIDAEAAAVILEEWMREHGSDATGSEPWDAGRGKADG